MPRLSINLDRDGLAALADVGMRERRTPRDQAGYIIAEVLRREGALPQSNTAPAEPAIAAGVGR